MVRLFRLLVILAVVFVLLLLFRPDALVKAGNVLTAVGSSNASGTAHMLFDQGSKAANLQLNLQGLALHLEYTITINEGKCDGKVLATINKVTPDTQGHVQTTFSYKDLNAIQQQGGVWVNVHKGDASGPSVACGLVGLENTTTDGQQTNTTSNNTSLPGNGRNQTLPGYAPNTVTNLPNTGVAPATSDSYDNYKYPHRR